MVKKDAAGNATSGKMQVGRVAPSGNTVCRAFSSMMANSRNIVSSSLANCTEKSAMSPLKKCKLQFAARLSSLGRPTGFRLPIHRYHTCIRHIIDFRTVNTGGCFIDAAAAMPCYAAIANASRGMPGARG